MEIISNKISKKKIAIIGAGISGLVACKHMMERGFEPVVFESQSGLGGVWSKTLETTKLQTPKDFYQFSDFPWPDSVQETFPDHNQVLDYLVSYATHFDVLSRIRFNTKVANIEYCNGDVDNVFDDLNSWDLWGGSGEPFSSSAKWRVAVQDARGDPSAQSQVYEMDFVVLCIGTFSGLPNIPEFAVNKGPEVVDGVTMHAMDYAAWNDKAAAEFVSGKRVTVVGFQKSAIDLAAEVANRNGPKYPCTLLFRTVHWTVPEQFMTLSFRNFNRFAEMMVHKPNQGFFQCLLTSSLSPLLWIFSKVVEMYLKWVYPLKKYNMVPEHGFVKETFSCMSGAVTPPNFYDKVRDRSLVLKKSKKFVFCKNGLVVEEEADEETHVPADIVIFATGYKTDQKLKNIFSSVYFQKRIIGSSIPFYRDCIHPRIPNLAILGYADSPASLFTTEIRSKWLAHLVAGNFKLPGIKEMEENVRSWEKCRKSHAGGSDNYRRYCLSGLVQIYCNDQLCKDMGFNPKRKGSFWADLFAPYGPADYKNL